MIIINCKFCAGTTIPITIFAFACLACGKVTTIQIPKHYKNPMQDQDEKILDWDEKRKMT